MSATEPKYPEHAKIAAIKDTSQAIGEFLEWLRQEGVTLCRWQEANNNGEPYLIAATPELLERIRTDFGEESVSYVDCESAVRLKGKISNPYYQSWSEGYVPDYIAIERRLAAYFEIDLDKKDAEEREMLAVIRGEA